MIRHNAFNPCLASTALFEGRHYRSPREKVPPLCVLRVPESRIRTDHTLKERSYDRNLEEH